MSIFSHVLAPIRAGLNEAKSYYKPLAVSAKNISALVATGGNLKWRAMKGAVMGSAGGAAYNMWDDNSTSRSVIKASLKGAVLGAAGGATYGLGRSAYANRAMIKGAGLAMKVAGSNVVSAARTAYQARALGGTPIRDAYSVMKSTAAGEIATAARWGAERIDNFVARSQASRGLGSIK
jgi:hypothetical protein